MRRGSVASLACLVALAFARLAWCDGGVPILVERVGDRTWTLMMRPARATVGPIELDLLGPAGAEVLLEMREGNGPWEVLPFEPGPEARVSHAPTELTAIGPCEFRLRVGGADTQALARVEVAERSAAMSAHAPWALAWIPMVLVLWLRSRALRARLYTAPHG